MVLEIGKRICELRRGMGVSQEQLAGFAGVSVAAVSKWETQSSYPDITLLPMIADFFCVSVDALLGYEVKGCDYADIKEKARAFDESGDYNAGIGFIENARCKYPNDFELMLRLAGLKYAKGTSGKANRECLLEAAELYGKCAAIAPAGYEWTEHSAALCVGMAGEYGRAIEMLEKIGEGRLYAADIALFLKKQGRYDEAKKKLQKQLQDIVFTFSAVTGGLAECFEREGDEETALSLYELCADFTAGFTENGRANYYDWVSASNYTRLAKRLRTSGLEGRVFPALEKAFEHAVRFDENPSYKTSDIAFMEGLNGWISNTSEAQACTALISALETDFADKTGEEKYIKMLARLRLAQKSKAEAGIWQK